MSTGITRTRSRSSINFIEKTDTENAPWTLVEATDRKYAILKLYSTIVKALEKKTGEIKERKQKKGKQKEPVLAKEKSGKTTFIPG